MTAKDLYQQKLRTPDDAIAEIADGSNLIISMGVSQPPALLGAVERRVQAGTLTHLKTFYMHGAPAAAETILKPEYMDVIKPHPLFMSAVDRALAEEGRKQGKEWMAFVPCVFHQAGRLLTETISPDCFVVTVSPMDKSGHFSLGTNADYGATVVRKAKKVIVEVNKHMPRTFGECLLHISDIDLVVEHDAVLPALPAPEPKEEDKTIGKLIAGEIPDRATLQMGIGSVPAVVMSYLEDHKDLGIHSELFTRPMVDLIKAGVVTGRFKETMPHKHVFTLAVGDEETYDFMDDNPSIVGYPVDWVNNPWVIRKNRGMISVNAAIEVDLTGQVNAETMRGITYSGTGGQLDFVRGAYAAEQGRSFIALHSTAKKGTLSRIVPQLSTVTDPRMDTHIIVTEYGMADLKGLSLAQRATALINLAHPSFREELEREARERRLL